MITAALAVSGFVLTLVFASWRDGWVWSVQPPQQTVSQKLQLPPTEQKVGLPAAPAPQAAATPADNPADEPTTVVVAPEAPAYESLVDRDEESGHASRHR